SWLGVDQNTREFQRGIDALPDYDRDRVRDALTYAMTPESDGVVNLEYGIRNIKTGRERIINVQARTTFDERGKPIKMMGTALDVTAQRNRRLQLEEEVRQRTEELDEINEVLKITNEELQTINGELAELNNELAQSNENLQQFAHVASHDLKEPVRKIKIFLGMIETDKETLLSARSRLFMQRVNASADRMFSMINGVLAFSTVNASEHPVEQVNLEVVMNNIIHDLDVLIAQKKATITYHDLPRFDGVEILIYQLLSNLLINSLKFSRKDVPPVIELTATGIIKDNIPFIQLVITDNGIGFESRQSEKIFQTFARLHSKDKFEGTGLGLALCQKIVIQHGGTIRASGQPGKGAVFTILLPERHSKEVM
ncbi:MAG TPA: ATP-binding protein, partial [Flavitalea sp.]|nr:ATP-binding protein [Flavitalea sp.]